MNDDIREQLATLMHDQWAAYMGYFLDKCEPMGNTLVISSAYVVALRKQIATPYADLTEQEKNADREEADKVLATIGVMGGD